MDLRQPKTESIKNGQCKLRAVDEIRARGGERSLGGGTGMAATTKGWGACVCAWGGG